LLENLGYKVVVSGNAYERWYYMAGSVEARAQDFNSLIHDDEVKMIMASWGGKSSNQLIDKIDYEGLASRPKLVCGFSDPASFLNAIFAMTGVPTLYGPDVVGKLTEDPPEDLDKLVSLITKKERLVYSGQDLDDSYAINGGVATGTLVGGNLSCFITGVLGTPYEPQLDGSIFFFESDSPKPRELHQMMTYLRHCRVFERVSGIVIGNVAGRDERTWANRPFNDIIEEETRGASIPIVSLPIFGHGDCPKAPIPIGIPAKLDANTLTLELLSPLVEE